MTGQVRPNAAQQVNQHQERQMQRTNSIQLLDTINAGLFSKMPQPQIKLFSDHFSTAC